ncbi:MAG: cytochrome P450 [bacterium]|nr:cytochrome P450 [bacterium]
MLETAPPDLFVNWLGPEIWNDSPEMYGRLCWLRKNDPVHWSEQSRIWVLTRYDDVDYVSKHQELFTSGRGSIAGAPLKLPLLDDEIEIHKIHRKMLGRGFTPKRVNALEKNFRRLTQKAILEVLWDGQCDFVEKISVPLPLLLIANLIGIPEDKYPELHQWSDDMILGVGSFNDPTAMERSQHGFVEFARYINDLAEQRKKDPQDDLISLLVGAKERGDLGTYDVPEHRPRGAIQETEESLALGSDEMTMFFVVLLVAGNETTRNAISGGIQLLIENRDERMKLIQHPELLESAVEEMIRHVTPVRTFARTVVEQTELGGRHMYPGQKVLLVYPSANRDAEHFDAPNDFRIDRNPEHLAFGIGEHFCLGASLARMETRVVIEEVLRRMPQIEYDGIEGPTIEPGPLVRSIMSMKVKY